MTAVAVTTLAAITACSTGKPAAAPPAATTPAVPTTAAAAPSVASSDYQSELACRLLDEGTRSEFSDPLDEETVVAIANAASASSNKGIQFAGEILAERHVRAFAAAGTDDEKSTAAMVDDAAAKLKSACSDAGLTGS